MAPVALTVAVPRSRGRDAAVCALQHVGLPRRLRDAPRRPRAPGRAGSRRLPDRVDRVLGLGVPPTVRLQRAFAHPDSISDFERVLVWCHWMWFAVPHGSVAYVLLRRRSASPPPRRGCTRCSISARSSTGRSRPRRRGTRRRTVTSMTARPCRGAPDDDRVRRASSGGTAGSALYDVLGGNPLAAMPSLHFATSVMAAHLLSEVGPVAGALGWTLRGHARPRARLPRRALRRRPDRRRALGRDRSRSRRRASPRPSRHSPAACNGSRLGRRTR